jgi:hypothetical protein
MPFASDKQRAFLYSQKPDVAKKFAADAKLSNKAMVKKKVSAVSSKSKKKR